MDMKTTTTKPPRVLVVDDEEKNRMLLRDSLEVKGFVVEEATNGREALDKIAARPPDAVLLDVMMPEMDGYEACRMLKNNPTTAAIPVIMITALSDREERLSGIKEGANDFLTKPIDVQEVLLRVRNAVQGKRALDEVRQSNQKLEHLILRSDLTYQIIQELLKPLSSMMESLDQLNLVSASKLETHEHRWVKDARRGAIDMERTIQLILDMARFEANDMPINLSVNSLNELLKEVRNEARARAMRVEPAQPDFNVMCDRELTLRVLSSLVDNAVKLTGDAGAIDLRVVRNGALSRIYVSDNGPEIPAEYRTGIFSAYKRDEKNRQWHSASVSLTFCKLAVEAQHGQIGVESNPAGGNSFWIELPVA